MPPLGQGKRRRADITEVLNSDEEMQKNGFTMVTSTPPTTRAASTPSAAMPKQTRSKKTRSVTKKQDEAIVISDDDDIQIAPPPPRGVPVRTTPATPVSTTRSKKTPATVPSKHTPKSSANVPNKSTPLRVSSVRPFSSRQPTLVTPQRSPSCATTSSTSSKALFARPSSSRQPTLAAPQRSPSYATTSATSTSSKTLFVATTPVLLKEHVKDEVVSDSLESDDSRYSDIDDRGHDLLGEESVSEDDRAEPMRMTRSRVPESVPKPAVKHWLPEPLNCEPSASTYARSFTAKPTRPSTSNHRFMWEAVKPPYSYSERWNANQYRSFIKHHGPTRNFNQPLFTHFNASPVSLLHRHAKTSGAIMHIAQASGNIAVASVTSGGTPDDPDDPDAAPDPYNREGNLIVWRQSEFIDLKTHRRAWTVNPEVETEGGSRVLQQDYEKYYTVNDVAFCPENPEIMVSCGTDGLLKTWSTANELGADAPVIMSTEIKYPVEPHLIRFMPESSIFATGSYDEFIRVHQDTTSGEFDKIPACGSNARVGSLIWGDDDRLFFHSECEEDHNGLCRHGVIDVETGRPIYKAPTRECGDSLAFDEANQILALTTVKRNEQGDTHTVYLIDMDSRDNVHSFTLAPSRLEDHALEVTASSFSPDGMYLALARDDNEVHVYDVRNTKTIYLEFKHPRKKFTMNFGITDCSWIEGFIPGGLGLVTAGSDGCVRLWDSRGLHDEYDKGTVLAEVENDIAGISLGDPRKGEYRLVVGDCGGNVYVYP